MIGKNKRPWNADFESGSRVEVTSEEEGFDQSWFAATTIGSVGDDKLLVEYLDLVTDDRAQKPLRCEAEIRHVRPEPPQPPPATSLARLQRVDTWYNDGWWEGVISQIRPGGLYAVSFESTDEEMAFRRDQLRPHQDWVDGKWESHSESEENLTESSCEDAITGEVEAAFEVGMDMEENSAESSSDDAISGKEGAVFEVGMDVEVRSDEDGYEGARFTAKIVAPLDGDKYVVEYKTLTTDDKTAWLREVARGEDIRPCPADTKRVFGFVVGENVDCWWNGGWWSGRVSWVLADRFYMVSFALTHEEIEFGHNRLRPHQEWRRGIGKWIYSPAL